MDTISLIEKLHNKYVNRKENIESRELTTHSITRLEVIEDIIDDLERMLNDLHNKGEVKND